MLRAPQWRGATQTHFAPRPRKSAWRCDIASVISPRCLPTRYTSNRIARYRQSSRSPATRRVYTAACFALPSGTAPRKWTSHQDLANPHGAAFAARSAHTRSNHVTLEANTSESSSATLFPVLHVRCKLATSESSSERLFPVLHLFYKLASQV